MNSNKVEDINFNDFKVRCSAINKIQSNSQSNPCLTELQAKELADLDKKEAPTDKQKERIVELRVKEANGKKIVLSDTCIEYLMEEYAWRTERMIPVNRESMDLLQIRKGKMQEQTATQLLSIVDGVIYSVHKDRIYNEYLSGEIDLYLGESVYKAQNISDIKNSFDYPTFLKKINKGLENGNQQQMQGYCDITNSPVGYIVHALVDTPPEIIEEMKYKVAKKFNAFSVESPDFLLEWAKWEHSMNFSHMAPQKRIFKVKIEPFTKFEQQKVYDRVKICREWLNNFHLQYSKLNG